MRPSPRTIRGSQEPSTRFWLSALDRPVYCLGIPQPSTERVLEDFLQRGGVQVERGVRFVGLAQDESGVTVHLEYLEDRRTDEAHVFRGPAGALQCHPMPGVRQWRLAVDLPPLPPRPNSIRSKKSLVIRTTFGKRRD